MVKNVVINYLSLDPDPDHHLEDDQTTSRTLHSFLCKKNQVNRNNSSVFSYDKHIQMDYPHTPLRERG